MQSVRFSLVIVFFVPCLLFAQAQGDATWSDAWSWSNALTVMGNVEAVYDAHASALIHAGDELGTGTAGKSIVDGLAKLPGIRGVILSRINESSVESTGLGVASESFDEFIFNRTEATAKYKSPMAHRKVGGLTHYIRRETESGTLDLMVYYVKSNNDSLPKDAISLVLDRDWLLPQIPAMMDSLSRENRQLLFWADSPTNKLVEQSLGIISGIDTLWWSGKRDVQVLNVQSLWPFADIEIHSFVRRLETK